MHSARYAADRIVTTLDDIHVRYCLTDDLGDEVQHAAVALLSDEERAGRGRLRVERDRREYAVAHALLRLTLSELGDLPPHAWRFEATAHGKPVIAPGVSASPLSFNLSHADGLVACAVTAHADVGIDVERVTRSTNWSAVAARFFSAVEVAQIERMAERDRARRFFALWTLKEAFAKARGLGLSQALDAAIFDLAPTGVIVVSLPPGASPSVWQFALFEPTPEHGLAVAAGAGAGRILPPLRTAIVR